MEVNTGILELRSAIKTFEDNLIKFTTWKNNEEQESNANAPSYEELAKQVELLQNENKQMEENFRKELFAQKQTFEKRLFEAEKELKKKIVIEQKLSEEVALVEKQNQELQKSVTLRHGNVNTSELISFPGIFDNMHKVNTCLKELEDAQHHLKRTVQESMRIQQVFRQKHHKCLKALQRTSSAEQRSLAGGDNLSNNVKTNTNHVDISTSTEFRRLQSEAYAQSQEIQRLRECLAEAQKECIRLTNVLKEMNGQFFAAEESKVPRETSIPGQVSTNAQGKDDVETSSIVVLDS